MENNRKKSDNNRKKSEINRTKIRCRKKNRENPRLFTFLVMYHNDFAGKNASEVISDKYCMAHGCATRKKIT